MSQQRGNPSLESELRSAIATYVEQIGILNDAIEGDPENNEEAISVSSPIPSSRQGNMLRDPDKNAYKQSRLHCPCIT